MVKLKYSKDKNWYYLPDEVCGFCNWVSTKTYKSKEEVKALITKGLDFAILYDDSYYRLCKPFNLWKIKSGEEGEIDKEHTLSRDYCPCDTCKKRLSEASNG